MNEPLPDPNLIISGIILELLSEYFAHSVLEEWYVQYCTGSTNPTLASYVETRIAMGFQNWWEREVRDSHGSYHYSNASYTTTIRITTNRILAQLDDGTAPRGLASSAAIC